MGFAEWQQRSILFNLWSMQQGIDEIQRMLRYIQATEAIEMATLQDIRSKVEAEKTVEDSAVALLQEISQMLKDAQANNDPEAIQEIVDMLDANAKTLGDAVTANTPAATA